MAWKARRRHLVIPSTDRVTTAPRALLLYGGWEGHQPEVFAEFAKTRLLGEFSVTVSQDLDLLTTVLDDYDLLVPIWTFGELDDDQVSSLLLAVERGLGIVCWHGAASSFLNSRSHKFLLGGQFVGHPGGEHIPYTVRFLGNDPLVEGLKDLDIVSEQYYLLIDPAVKVIATTSIDGADYDWLAGVEMPIAWKRTWGQGRVFYCAVGHTPDLLEHDAMLTMLRRALKWAVRGSDEAAATALHSPRG